jgi:hypothetical protein
VWRTGARGGCAEYTVWRGRTGSGREGALGPRLAGKKAARWPGGRPAAAVNSRCLFSQRHAVDYVGAEAADDLRRGDVARPGEGALPNAGPLLGVQRLRRHLCLGSGLHLAAGVDPCKCFRQLDPAAPGSHDEEYVYPIGFRTSRKHASAANPGSKCLYHSEIVAGPQGTPQFKVTCADMSEHSYEDSTPNVRKTHGFLS